MATSPRGGGSWGVRSLQVVVGLVAVGSTAPEPVFPSARLTSKDLEATVFVPDATSGYYRSTRFDHSSMVGLLRTRQSDPEGELTVFSGGVWRMPHDPFWTESGIGLAEEFGCGMDGTRCGGLGDDNSTNGVLGYEEAEAGETFLKIGVGELRKGSCADCDGEDTHDLYRFNSPYAWAAEPEWTVHQTGPGRIEMVQELTLERRGMVWGYRLVKIVSVNGSLLTIDHSLENLGSAAFATPHYSHNFFTIDGHPTGPGFSLDLRLGNMSFREPGVDSWATPLTDVATITRDGLIRFESEPSPATKIKAEFEHFQEANGTFELTFNLSRSSNTNAAKNGKQGQHDNYEERATRELRGTRSVRVRKTMDGPLPLRAMNLYVERGTLSPEPVVLISLPPGETQSWSHTVEVQVTGSRFAVETTQDTMSTGDSKNGEVVVGQRIILTIVLLLLAISGLLCILRCCGPSRRQPADAPEVELTPWLPWRPAFQTPKKGYASIDGDPGSSGSRSGGARSPYGYDSTTDMTTDEDEKVSMDF